MRMSAHKWVQASRQELAREHVQVPVLGLEGVATMGTGVGIGT